MKTYIISDTHFNHYNIIKYCDRPFKTVEEMNQTIINNWNEIVKPDDIVWHLGDIGLGSKDKVAPLVKRLNGRKRLIKGNHDNLADSTYREMGFEYVSKYPIVLGNYILSHHPLVPAPPYINLYGHVHDKTVDTEYSKCVCVEVTDYKPIELKI